MDTRDYALIGAATRLRAIEQERREILKRFPKAATLGTDLGRLLPVAPKRKVSAAAKKAMSEGMRKFWARRKAAVKKPTKKKVTKKTASKLMPGKD